MIATAVFSGTTAIASIFTLLLVFGIRDDAATERLPFTKRLDDLLTLSAHLRTGPLAERWEYTVVALPDTSFEAESKKMGDEGWEIITARRATNERDEYSYEVIAKRRTFDGVVQVEISE